MKKNNFFLNYKINKVLHKVIFSKKTADDLKNDIKSIKHNPKILFIYDKNINPKMIKKFKKKFKSLNNDSYNLPVVGGKHNKDTDLLFKIINILSEKNFTKNSIIVSIGGGVVGDVSSFAAAIYMRGIIYFHIPSTMTSILDSCIGGKTAVNFDNKINLLGTYYHPLTVYISYEILQTIPDREYRSGFAEAIKCGIIDDFKILKILNVKFNKIMKRDFITLQDICSRVLKSKIKFFVNDIREKNQRLCLNFGHTFAHAIEMASSLKNKYQINHGEAVALGILCEMKYGKVSPKLCDYTNNLFKKYGLTKEIKIYNVSKKKFFEKIYKNLFLDKKRISKYPRYIRIDRNRKPIIDELRNLKKVKKIIFSTLNTINE